MLPLPFSLIWHFGEAMRWKGQKLSRLLLNAKGGEIKAKANGSANHLWISKIIRICILPKWLLLQNLVSYGGEFWLWKKGGVLALNQFYSCNISLFAQTSVFDLEIRKRIWFAKTN
jgi:hypothetical protein